jgi:hypothetical protein
MKPLFAVLGLFVALTVPASAQAVPPEQPWFSQPLLAFLDTPQPTVLGWSRRGAAALLLPVDAGGRGGPVVRLLLVDAVGDKVLFDKTLWGDEYERLQESDEALAFIEACYNQGMQPADIGAGGMRAFPLTFEASRITAAADNTPGKDNDAGFHALDYRVTVTSSARGTKTIASRHLDQAWQAEIEGYFLSPFEPRILVVYTVSEPGFEGERPKTYYVSGCHLRVGFSR